MNSTKRNRIVAIGLAGLFVVGSSISISHSAFAVSYQEQINALNNDSGAKRESAGQLGAEAASLQDAISKLQAQIAALQGQIADTEKRRDDTVAQIVQAEADLAKNRKYLADSIKASYVDGGVSSLEMLASSRNINQFVDQQQYQNSVQGQMQRTLDTIKQLEAKLTTDKTNLERMLTDLNGMSTAVSAQRTEQARLLSLNQAQQQELDTQIKANTAKVGELQRLQALENARLSGGKPGVGINCGGGYPGQASGRYGTWGCNYGLDQGLDNWGMYNRQCVSYTAFKVSASGRYMPAWGSMGMGNAKQWDDNARRAGIPVDSSPRVGDVAVSNAGDYGHVMYVEAVSGDGSIFVSDYNQQWDGRYREYWISAGNVSSKDLVFIHF